MHIRILLALAGLAAALLISIVLLWLSYHAIRRLWRMVCLVVCFIGKTLATLWQTAFPKSPPRPPSPSVLHLVKIARALARQHQCEKSNELPPSPRPCAELSPRLPIRDLARPLKPGENCLWVGEIQVIVREINGKFEFETNPKKRWNDAMNYLQDEGLLEKILNRTIRWGDHQNPPQG